MSFSAYDLTEFVVLLVALAFLAGCGLPSAVEYECEQVSERPGAGASAPADTTHHTILCERIQP